MQTQFNKIKQERDALAIRIAQIEGRLLSGYSRPLDDSLTDLLKQDMKLICQTTDLLTSAPASSSKSSLRP